MSESYRSLTLIVFAWEPLKGYWGNIAPPPGLIGLKYIIKQYHYEKYIIKQFHYEKYIIKQYHYKKYIIKQYHYEKYIIKQYHYEKYIIKSSVIVSEDKKAQSRVHLNTYPDWKVSTFRGSLPTRCCHHTNFSTFISHICSENVASPPEFSSWQLSARRTPDWR